MVLPIYSSTFICGVQSLWNIGSGYNQFDKQEEMVHLFHSSFV
jgi:hypothetical protein